MSHSDQSDSQIGVGIRPKALAELIEWAREDGYDLEIRAGGGPEDTGEDRLGWEVALTPAAYLPADLERDSRPESFPGRWGRTLDDALIQAWAVQNRRRMEGLRFGDHGSDFRGWVVR